MLPAHLQIFRINNASDYILLTVCWLIGLKIFCYTLLLFEFDTISVRNQTVYLSFLYCNDDWSDEKLQAKSTFLTKKNDYLNPGYLAG